MDLTRPITYRSFEFNTMAVGANGVSEGCTVERVLYGDVETVGYTEKQALADGFVASDVFLGRRRFALVGNLHGYDRNGLYDQLRAMRFAVSPRLAFLDANEKRGFYPLSFYEPTGQVSDWEGGVVPLMLMARSLGGVSTEFNRSKTGGKDVAPISIQYMVRFECIDPKAYLRDRVERFISGSAGNLQLENRGGYPVPLNIMLVVKANPNVRVFSFVGGGADFTVTIPGSEEVQVVRLDGEQRFVTVQVNETEVSAMHMRTINSPWPELPLGVTDVAWTFKRENGTDADLAANSLMWHREAYA